MPNRQWTMGNKEPKLGERQKIGCQMQMMQSDVGCGMLVIASGAAGCRLHSLVIKSEAKQSRGRGLELLFTFRP